MSILNRRAVDLPPASVDDVEPHRDIARRLADAAADDVRSYAETGGDLDAWPKHGAWRDRDSKWFIEPRDRPFYRRDRAEDLALANDTLAESRAKAIRGTGPMITPDEIEYICHAAAVHRARALRLRAEFEAREARLDLTDRRCVVCGTTGDRTVKPRDLGGMRTTRDQVGYVLSQARICDHCWPVTRRELAGRIDRQTDELAAQQVGEHSRGELAEQWINDNAERLIR